MKKYIIYIILLLLIIGGLGIYIVSTNKGKEDSKVGNSKQVQEVKKEEKKKESEKSSSKPSTSGDFSKFSVSRQEIGSLVSEDSVMIEKIKDSAEDGYHQFVFTVSGSETPLVSANYIGTAGAIKIQFSNVKEDNSGIPFQGERVIDKNGIIRIYRNVSGSEKKSYYDIGLSQSTPFRLWDRSGDNGKHEVILDVKYPGEKMISGNLGSTEFSTSEQSITGVGIDENASIISYEYSASGGILKFVLGVSADGDSPIPSAKAEYDSNGDLVVVFDSLKLDRVGGSSRSYELPLGIKLDTLRSGNSTTYTFRELGEKSSYKLSASLSPNQVLIEIK